MKRKVSMIVAVALLCACLAACGTEIPNATPEEQIQNEEQIRALLSDWYQYLCVNERCYEDMLWTLSYVDGFLAGRDWEGLVCARTALDAAARDLGELEKPAETMTAEGYAFLEEQGLDVSFVPMVTAYWTETKTTCSAKYKALQNEFNGHEALREQGLRVIAQGALLERDTIETRLDSLAEDTDYLLFTLGDSALTERFRADVAENCPLIAAHQSASYESEQDFEEKSVAIAARLEELVTRSSEVNGQWQAYVDLYNDAWNTDYASLMEGAAKVEGAGTVLPDPGWPWGYAYFYKTEDGTLISPAVGDDLKSRTIECVMTCPEVDEVSYQSYLEILTQLGYATDGGAAAFAWDGDSIVVTMPEGPVLFAPLWYIYAVGALPR